VLAVGNPLGVAIQVVCQLPSLRRLGVTLRPRIDLHDPALRDTLSIGLPTLVATLASVPTTAVMSSCALSVTEAGASVAYYARIWYMLPYSIFAIPI
jgi:putative peptidoglycan lipid II flippase